MKNIPFVSYHDHYFQVILDLPDPRPDQSGPGKKNPIDQVNINQIIFFKKIKQLNLFILINLDKLSPDTRPKRNPRGRPSLSSFYLLSTQKLGFYSKAKMALAQMKYKPLESTAEGCLKRIQANLTTLQLNDFLPFLLGKTHCTLHISGLPILSIFASLNLCLT